MGTFFDSEVYAERRRLPWMNVDPEHLFRDLTQHEHEVTLTVVPRPSVASRFWWSLSWTGEDGQAYGVSAQTLELCLWRAALREKKTRSSL